MDKVIVFFDLVNAEQYCRSHCGIRWYLCTEWQYHDQLCWTIGYQAIASYDQILNTAPLLTEETTDFATPCMDKLQSQPWIQPRCWLRGLQNPWTLTRQILCKDWSIEIVIFSVDRVLEAADSISWCMWTLNYTEWFISGGNLLPQDLLSLMMKLQNLKPSRWSHNSRGQIQTQSQIEIYCDLAILLPLEPWFMISDSDSDSDILWPGHTFAISEWFQGHVLLVSTLLHRCRRIIPSPREGWCQPLSWASMAVCDKIERTNVGLGTVPSGDNGWHLPLANFLNQAQHSRAPVSPWSPSVRARVYAL